MAYDLFPRALAVWSKLYPGAKLSASACAAQDSILLSHHIVGSRSYAGPDHQHANPVGPTPQSWHAARTSESCSKSVEALSLRDISLMRGVSLDQNTQRD